MGDCPFPGPTGHVGGMGGIAPDEYPERCGTNIDFIWNANNRMVTGTEFDKLGDGGYDRGARARQIRDDLRQLWSATQKDMLDIQLDDRAVFLERWHRPVTLNSCRTPESQSNRERVEFQALAWGLVGPRRRAVYRVSLGQGISRRGCSPSI